MSKIVHETIQTLDDLRSEIWELIGYVDMNTVDEILDLVKRHQKLLEDHAKPR